MEFSVDQLHRMKVILHGVQGFLIFVAWCINIALFTTYDTTIGRADGWYFALCFLSVPVLLYQALTLHFARSRKWANAYAFAVLDVVWTICWLSAFASVAAWNTAGKCGGSKGCGLSKAMVGLGFFIFLFFAVTSAISVHGAIYFRREGALPGSSRIPTNAAMIDPDREAFSTAPHDEYAPLGVNDKDDDDHEHRIHGSGSRYDMNTTYGGSEMGGGHNVGMAGAGAYQTPDDIGGNNYHSAYAASEAPSYHTNLNEPSEYNSQLPPIQPGERLQFPAGNYH